MRSKYDGIHYYEKGDLATGWELEKCVKFIDGFNASKQYTDINEVIELYNVYELINSDVLLTNWTPDYHASLKSDTKSFMAIIAKFFSGISNDNFIEQESSVSIGYFDDFWCLFVKFQVFKRISEDKFSDYLKKPDTTLYKLLKHKELVYYYDSLFTTVLRNSDQTADIIVSKYLRVNSSECYLPKGLKPDEFDGILLSYVKSDRANANVLDLIYYAQSSGDCPISDELRLAAKRAYKEFWEKHQEGSIKTEYGIGVSFVDQNNLRAQKNEGLNYHITYDIKWFEENLDYPTVLNNFRHVFEMLDDFCRCTFVSIESHLGVFERVFKSDGVKFYQTGAEFNIAHMCSLSQMKLYCNFLKEHDIEIEDVIKWFFEKYIPDEFCIDGFSYYASTPTSSYVEKCKNIVSEMDGVFKQYRMFVRNGYIDRELFEISSEHIILGDIPSLIPNKYAYANSVEIRNEMHALFSDQSTLSYIEKIGSEYSTLFELLISENVTLSDFNSFQRQRINWLLERGSLINFNGFIKINRKRVWLLKDLYDHDVICPYYLKDLDIDLESLINSDDIVLGSSLFSVPEKNYLNYELNKAEFSNGLDLRNKYSHGTYRKNDNSVNESDYYELLKIMILVVSKINDELCFNQ